MNYDVRTATGDIAAVGNAVVVDMEAMASAGVEITGTWVGTIIAEISVDSGTTWRQVDLFNVAFGTETIVANTGANGTYKIHHAGGGVSKVRVKASAWTSGTATAKITATLAPSLHSEVAVPDGNINPGHGSMIAVTDGANLRFIRTANIFKIVAAVAITAGTGATIWTPAAGKKFRLMGYSFSSSAAASLIFGDNLVGTVIFRGPLLAAAGIDVIQQIGNGILSAAVNNVLKLDVSATSTVTGTVWGTEE